MTFSLSVCIPDPRWKKKGAELRLHIRRAVKAALASEEIKDAALSVRCVSAEEMRRLNHDFRGKNKPTNVLSFPDGAMDEEGRTYLGDIVIALDVVQTEAREQKKPFAHHLTHLALHGTLHLLGHDHEEHAEAERMESKEIALLQAFGIKNPYR